jgi:hypothetical protein
MAPKQKIATIYAGNQPLALTLAPIPHSEIGIPQLAKRHKAAHPAFAPFLTLTGFDWV